MPFLRLRRHSAGILSVLAVLAGFMGCLFDSNNFVPEPRYWSSQLDTLMPAGFKASRTVRLFQPLRDPSLAGKPPAAAEVMAPVKVKDAESGEVIAYELTRRRYGEWTPELEFQWNYFLLQVYFLFPGGVPDTAGLAGDTRKLYEEIHKSDLFTNYFDSAAAPAAMDRITKTTKPGALGIEVSLNVTDDSVVVRHVVPASPAGRAGIAKGMIVLAVDDSSVTGDSAIQRFARFSAGDSGEAGTLRMLTPRGVQDFRLIREPVAFPTVYVDSLDGIGYISISAFMPATVGGLNTAAEFKQALAATRRFPVTILDLRDNGGGSLDLTTTMCDEILPAGEVIIRQHQRQFSEEDHVPLVSLVHHLATSAGTAERRKFVQMGNGRSASAAEIFLVALREGIGAPIVGQKTYGKGVGQNVRNTPGKGLALVTFLKFTSQGGLDYHKAGIQPDHPDSSGNENQLIKAVEVAKAMAAGTAKVSGAASAVSREAKAALAVKARALEWNRLQTVRPGVREIETGLPPFP